MMKRKKNRKGIVWIGMLILLSLLLVGCGGASSGNGNQKKSGESSKDGVSIGRLTADIQNKDIFQSRGLTISKIDVIKRQTNVDDKEDNIYITVYAENDDYYVEQNFYVVYNLYNEGWILEKLDTYTDDKHIDKETPKSYPDIEKAKKDFAENNYDNENYFKSESYIHTSSYVTMNKKSDTSYVYTVQHEYDIFREISEVTLNYIFTDSKWLPTFSVSKSEDLITDKLNGVYANYWYLDQDIDLATKDAIVELNIYYATDIYYADVRILLNEYSVPGVGKTTTDIEEFKKIPIEFHRDKENKVDNILIFLNDSKYFSRISLEGTNRFGYTPGNPQISVRYRENGWGGNVFGDSQDSICMLKQK